jgi:hypothetical protein
MEHGVLSYNLSTEDAEAGGLPGPGQHGLHSETIAKKKGSRQSDQRGDLRSFFGS